MDFTENELNIFKELGYRIVSNKSALKSISKGYGWSVITKTDSGDIRYWCSRPINVDIDDASYDTEDSVELYHTVNEFIHNKPYNSFIE